MKKAKKYSAADIITTVGLLVVIYGFAVAMIASPDKEYSEDENRYLQTLPRFSIESVTSGKYTKDIASYCSDQMPLRGAFVGAKAAVEAASLKKENNSVLRGKDGYIIAKNDYADFDMMKKNIAAIKYFADVCGADLRVAVAGRSQDVLLRYMPSLYPAKEVSDAVFDRLNDTLDTAQIDLLTPLRERADGGEYVYYKTDHHWTTLGAYYAYVEIISSYGIEPYPLEYFRRETVSDEFYGTTWSKAGMKWIGPDQMEFFRFEGDENFVCEIVDSGEIIDGFYERSYLDGKDKYSAFIGGNNGRVKIYLDEPQKDRETLVLIKDSFAHSLAPFLAMHFDLDVIDLRYYKLPVAEVIAESAAEKVLIMYNIDSLISAKDTLLLMALSAPVSNK